MSAVLKHKLKKRVLLVEDDQDLRNYLSQELLFLGFEVVQADNGEKALKVLKSQPIDIILSDVCMPELDGEQLMRVLSSYENAPPVLFMTAMADPAKVDEIKSLGAILVLEKPTKIADLEFILNSTLKLRNQEIQTYGAPRLGIRPLGDLSSKETLSNAELSEKVHELIRTRQISR